MLNAARVVIAVGMALVLIALLASQTSAQSDFLKKVRREYGLDPRVTGKCTLCHAPDEKKKEKPNEENLNAYGKAVHDHKDMKPLLGKGDKFKFKANHMAILIKVVEALNDQDTDGDGATNGEELALETFPADKESTPDKKKLERHRKKNKDSGKKKEKDGDKK